MTEKKTNTEAETTGNDYIIKLSKTYQFEERSVSEVDMSGIEDLTTRDMIRANKILLSGNTPSLSTTEMTVEYAMVIASFSSDLPLEFFMQLKPKDTIRVRKVVLDFFYGKD